KRSPVRQRMSDRDGVEGDVDGPSLLRDGADILFHRLLVEGIDLRGLGDSAAADDVGRNRLYLWKVPSTQKELRALQGERARDSQRPLRLRRSPQPCPRASSLAPL